MRLKTSSALAGLFAVGLLASGGANAALVQTAAGDPFPTGSFVILTPATPFSTPFGNVASILLSGFNSAAVSIGFPVSGTTRYTYASGVQFTNDFLDPVTGLKTGSFAGTIQAPGFVVDIFNRTPSFVSPGTFNAEIINATFSGDVRNLSGTVIGSQVTRVSDVADTLGTATFTGTVPDQFVSTLFNVNGQFAGGGTGGECLDLSGNPISGTTFPTCPFVDQSLTGNSNPTPTPAPIPATAALLIPGLFGMVALRRRRAAA